MKRYVKANKDLHTLSIIEENEAGKQNFINLEGSDIPELLDKAKKLLVCDIPYFGKPATPEAFADAIDEYNDAPGSYIVIQYKFDNVILAGLEDDEIEIY